MLTMTTTTRRFAERAEAGFDMDFVMGRDVGRTVIIREFGTS